MQATLWSWSILNSWSWTDSTIKWDSWAASWIRTCNGLIVAILQPWNLVHVFMYACSKKKAWQSYMYKGMLPKSILSLVLRCLATKRLLIFISSLCISRDFVYVYTWTVIIPPLLERNLDCTSGTKPFSHMQCHMKTCSVSHQCHYSDAITHKKRQGTPWLCTSCSQWYWKGNSPS